MATKRATISSDLFAKTEPASEPVKQQDAKPISQDTVMTARQLDSITARRLEVKPTKATFYLDAALLERLDMARARLRGMAPAEDRTSVTLSAVVGAALDAALADLESQGDKSQLASRLASWHNG